MGKNDATEPRPVTDLEAGQIQFLDNFIPTIRDGEYAINVRHSLSGGTAKASHALPDGKKDFTAKQLFTVRGPRFVLSGGDVHAKAPASGHSGQFQDELPHVVLNKRGLPWERGLKKADGHVPWMALIVLRADELLVVPTEQLTSDGKLKAGNQGVPEPKGLANPTRSGSFVLSDVLGPIYPVMEPKPDPKKPFDPRGGIGGSGPPADTQGPCLASIDLSTDEREIVVLPRKETSSKKPLLECRAIDIATETFESVVPKLSEAVHLAHVRQVDTGDKEILGIKDDGWFSVVVANRFPLHDDKFPDKPVHLPGATPFVAHLVSLEGFEPFLGDIAPNWAPGIEKVRMISLASWAFSVLPQPAESFADLMYGLTEAPEHGALDLKLRLPVSQPEEPNEDLAKATEAAKSRLSDGFVPLSYRTRPGEHTFAWYRGPLVPAPVSFIFPATGDEKERVASPTRATEAYVYDSQYGVFDLSYGVAFETGRNMALSDPVFAQSVMNWRRKLHQVLDLIHARISSEHLTGLTKAGDITKIAAHELEELLEERLLSESFVTNLVDKLGGEILPKGTTAQPKSDPWQPPKSVLNGHIRQQLEAVMAEPAVHSLLSKLPEALPAEIIDWLARRLLLDGVPFDNLVPAAAMLPVESIRFFHLDPNWLSCLIDGAFSVGTHTSRDTALYEIMRGPIFEGVYEIVHQLRDRLRKTKFSGQGAGSQHMSGFLLRSALVSGWPGLEVKAFTDAKGKGEEIKLLRMQRLSPNVLLVVFPGVPRCIQLNEPRESLRFGYETIRGQDAGARPEQGARPEKGARPERKNPDKDVFELRHISGDKIGEPFVESGETAKVFELQWKNKNMGVLDIGQTVVKIATGIGTDTASIKPGAFALNMIKVPEQMLFEHPG